MLAEWGVFERHDRPGFKESFFASVRREIGEYPQIKALVYFDSPRAPGATPGSTPHPAAGGPSASSPATRASTPPSPPADPRHTAGYGHRIPPPYGPKSRTAAGKGEGR